MNATLNQRAIRRVTLYEAREANLKETLAYAVKWKEKNMKGQDEATLPGISRPTKDVATTFLELSSTDGGEHRKDLVEALRAPQSVQPGLSLTVGDTSSKKKQEPQQPQKDGGL